MRTTTLTNHPYYPTPPPVGVPQKQKEGRLQNISIANSVQ